MDTKDQEKLIHRLGREMAASMRDFYGSVKFNLSGGKYVNSNVEQSFIPKPETQERKQ